MNRPILIRPAAVCGVTALFRATLISALALTAACGLSDAEPAGRAARTGQELYDQASCVTCHGPNGGGSPFAPPLRKLSTWWERESLAEFLLMGRSGEAPNEHIAELREEFRTRVMPPMTADQASREERLVLADWLLAR